MKLTHILEAKYAHSGPPWLQDPRKFQDLSDKEANEFSVWVYKKQPELEKLYNEVYEHAEQEIAENGSLAFWLDDMQELRSGVRVKSGDTNYNSIRALHDWPYPAIDQAYVIAAIFMIENYVMQQFNIQEAQYLRSDTLDPVKYVQQVLMGERNPDVHKINNAEETIAQLTQKYGPPDDTDQQEGMTCWRDISWKGRHFYVDVFSSDYEGGDEIYITDNTKQVPNTL